MKRREFLKSAAIGAAAGAVPLAAPRIASAQNARVLRFVPQANLANLDPIWTTQYVVRNAAVLIWDTLYGVNDKLEPQAADGARGTRSRPISKTWTFKLRTGLKFHDGEAVTDARRAAEPQPLDGARHHGPGDQDAARRAGGGGRPDVPLPPEPAVLEDAVRARQEQHADGAVHHAGADRHDRSVQADHRVCRFRADALQDRTNGCPVRRRCSRNSPTIRRAPRSRGLAVRRQAHASSTASNGRSSRTPPPPAARCRTARSTGWRRRCRTWYRC